jgi:glutaredoxin-like YruB-family protein
LALLAGVTLAGCLPGEGSDAKQGGGAAALLAAVTGGSEKAPVESGGEKVVYYKYVDESGSIRFVERREEVPTSQRDGARIEWKAEPRAKAAAKPASSRWENVSRALSSRLGTSDESGPSAVRKVNPEVVLYTTTWCGWCRKTIAHLDENGVRYENRDIERDRQAYADLKRKTGSTGVPVIEIDGELVIGFDRNRIDELLGL